METRTKTCGPIPGGLILTHSLVVFFFSPFFVCFSFLALVVQSPGCLFRSGTVGLGFGLGLWINPGVHSIFRCRRLADVACGCGRVAESIMWL